MSLVVADIGNTRIKLGWFSDKVLAGAAYSRSLPDPVVVVAIDLATDVTATRLAEACKGKFGPVKRALVAGTNPAALAALQSSWPLEWPQATVIRGAPDLPLKIEVEFPETVGADRLLNAVAVNRLRPAGQPAIIVDSGTATTVDFLTANGAFAGGAILPGFRLCGLALHHYTALLPTVTATDLISAEPSPVGRNTREAIRSGLFWGQIGAIRELVTRQKEMSVAAPTVVLTGGAAPLIAPHVACDWTISDLPLKGLALLASNR